MNRTDLRRRLGKTRRHVGARALRRTFGAMVATAGMTTAQLASAAGEQQALPRPRLDGQVSLEAALRERHSVREFRDQRLPIESVGQLLWAAQGVTREGGGRTAPSAGALYPLELYAVGGAEALHYLPAHHRAERWGNGDLRPALARAAHGQEPVAQAPLSIVITGVEARTRAKYGERAPRYVALEAGHAAQNVLLEATALGLGAVPIGAFDDDEVIEALHLPPGERPLYVISVGFPAGG